MAASAIAILRGPKHVTPIAITQVFRRAGVLTDAAVKTIQAKPIGVGLLGDTVRFDLTYDVAEAGPASIVGKFPAANTEVRSRGAALGIYLAETRFYQEFAPRTSMQLPRCYYAEIDPATSEAGLLLENLSPARSADQLTGCSRADAEHAMRQAAALHAAHFNDASLTTIDWLQARQRTFVGVAPDMQAFAKVYRERYSDLLESEYLVVVDEFAKKAADVLLRKPPRIALVHADYRLDNMLFDARSGKTPLVVVDWQSVAPDNPGIDTAFFMESSYPIPDRSRDERDLLRLYHDELQRHGLKGYDFASVWDDYRRGAWQGMFTAIVASAMAKRTERGDQLFTQLVRGSAALMAEHGTLSL